MNPLDDRRDLYLRFALFELTAEERDSVEEALISEPDYFQAFQEAENELLDAYAAGELSTQDRARVRRLIAANANVAEKATFSAALQGRELQGRPNLIATWRKLFASRTSDLVFAASLILLVAAGLLWYRLRPEWNARRVASQPGAASSGATKQQGGPNNATVLGVLLSSTSRAAGTPLSIHIRPQVASLDVQWITADQLGPASGLKLHIFKSARPVLTVAPNRFEQVDGEVVAHFPVNAAALAAGEYSFQLRSKESETGEAAPELETIVKIERIR